MAIRDSRHSSPSQSNVEKTDAWFLFWSRDLSEFAASYSRSLQGCFQFGLSLQECRDICDSAIQATLSGYALRDPYPEVPLADSPPGGNESNKVLDYPCSESQEVATRNGLRRYFFQTARNLACSELRAKPEVPCAECKETSSCQGGKCPRCMGSKTTVVTPRQLTLEDWAAIAIQICERKGEESEQDTAPTETDRLATVLKRHLSLKSWIVLKDFAENGQEKEHDEYLAEQLDIKPDSIRQIRSRALKKVREIELEPGAPACSDHTDSETSEQREGDDGRP